MNFAQENKVFLFGLEEWLHWMSEWSQVVGERTVPEWSENNSLSPKTHLRSSSDRDIRKSRTTQEESRNLEFWLISETMPANDRINLIAVEENR